MSCGGGHLEFPIDKKNPQNFVEVYPLIILTKFQFNWSSDGGHLEFPIDKKNPQNFVEVYPLIILTKFQFNWSKIKTL